MLHILSDSEILSEFVHLNCYYSCENVIKYYFKQNYIRTSHLINDHTYVSSPYELYHKIFLNVFFSEVVNLHVFSNPLVSKPEN